MALDTSLPVAVKKLPAQWTKSICEALSVPASGRDVERKAAITQHLSQSGSVRDVWAKLPGPSRRILAWLLLDQDGSATVRELYDEFGEDEDCSYYWNKGELPTTPLGLLRLHGLVFKGWTDLDGRRVKVAVVPIELRDALKSLSAANTDSPEAPPMPEPAFLKKSPRPEVLEAALPFRRSGRVGFTEVYQFMIVLRDIAPAVWRRIRVPANYSFWDLHVAIQDAMGWLDYHLHEFTMPGCKGGPEVAIGFADDEFAERNVLPDYAERIQEYFSMDNPGADYLYDFGDDWLHSVTLEAIMPADKGASYPACLAGERACPPEDCGGAPGYEDFLRIIGDPADEEHGRMIAWAGGSFDPELLEPSSVHFDDPYSRWRVAFLDDEAAYERLLAAREAAHPSGPVTYTNRRGDVYYLHAVATSTGKRTYRFTRKAEGELATRIPDGYEIYEHPDGCVYLRKVQKRIITDAEEELVADALRRAGIDDGILDVRKNTITVYLGDLSEVTFAGLFDAENMITDLLARVEGAGLSIPDELMELLPEMLARTPTDQAKAADALRHAQTYSPMLRFTLVDPGKRSFEVERACFSGACDDWKWLDGPAPLGALVRKYCRHLGRDSFYDL